MSGGNQVFVQNGVCRFSLSLHVIAVGSFLIVNTFPVSMDFVLLHIFRLGIFVACITRLTNF